MVVFGGYGAAGALNDVWALSLSGTPTWSPITPSGTPPSPRYWNSAIYDPIGDRMIVLGSTPPFDTPHEVWQLSFAPTPAWSPIVAAGTVPSGMRSAMTAVLDQVGSRVLLFGGLGIPGAVLSLNLVGPPSWTQVSIAGDGPIGRREHAAVFVPGRGMIAFGGFRQAGIEGPWLLSDTWELRFGDATLDVPATRLGVARLTAAPNPAQRSTTIEFMIAATSPVSLAVYDLSGRRVRALRSGSLAAGSHAVRWDLADDGGRRIAPGLYLVELRAGTERRTAKTIVVE
jgi:hypothetical protein